MARRHCFRQSAIPAVAVTSSYASFGKITGNHFSDGATAEYMIVYRAQMAFVR